MNDKQGVENHGKEILDYFNNHFNSLIRYYDLCRD